MAAAPKRSSKTRPAMASKPPAGPARPRGKADGCLDDRTRGLEAFVATAPIAVAMTDRRLRFQKVSPAWLVDFNLPESELIGRSSYDLAPETRKRYGALHRRGLAGEKVSSEPELIILPSGQRRWMMWDATPWRDDQDKVRGLLIISRDVTAQKEAEQEVRRAREFAATILDNVPAQIVVKGEDGRILLMNLATEKLFGASREDHLGRTPEELFPAEEALKIAEEDRKALASREPVVEESELTTPNNGVRRIRKTKVAVRSDDGGPTYLLAISEDITDWRKTQLELERTRAFLTTLIENVPLPLIVKDGAEGRIVMMNRANELLLGVKREALIGKSARDLFPSDEAGALIAEEQRVIASGELKIVEDMMITTPGNGARSLRQMQIAIRVADGEPYLLIISEDITERKKSADELIRTRAFLETVINSVPAGITVKDARDGRLLMMNPAVEAIYNVATGNIGKTAPEVFPSAQAERFAQQDREVIESGEMRTYEEEPVWTTTGRRYLRRKKLLIRNPEGSDYLLSISEDVTDRKQAEDALKEALARAEAANVAKSEFLANMSHEIRTPLNGVLGLADALERMELTAAQREIVEMIVSSGKALTGILSDVLDLAKAEAGQLELQTESFSLRDTVGQAAFLFQTAARSKGLSFKVTFDIDGADRLLGDPLRIKQVVSNLISNAVKFTSTGGISVRVCAAPDGDGGAALKITVRDTGPGFSKEVRAKLFGRFEQGDGSITRRYGGTGLGLSIASQLAQMMDGEIDCTATPGKGAAFLFRARLAIDVAPVFEAPVNDEQALDPERPLRILLAEDHEVNQKVVQLMLGAMAELVIVPDGQQAVDAFLTQSPFDVILMDTQMPVMDGLTAIGQIRGEEARLGRIRTPIISLTANAMAHQVEACLKAGADAHLAKPITSEGLYGAINRALEQVEPETGAATFAA